MDELNWQNVRGEFAFDGSWRDICVLGTTATDWQRMLDSLCVEKYQLTYFRDDKTVEMPIAVRDIFPSSDSRDRRLSVYFGGMIANCHFFTLDEIEFDIDPREVKGQTELDALFAFMRFISRATSKEVVLTAENVAQIVIFRLPTSTSKVEHYPFGGSHDWRT